MEKLIESITKLEATGKVSKDMEPFIVLKQYLENTITYRVAMKELKEYSGAYKYLVENIIKKHRNVREVIKE